MASPLGCLLSFLLPNLFFTGDESQFKNEFFFYLLVQTIIITCLSIPSMIFLKEEPPSPPTVLLKDSILPMAMGDSIKSLFSNRNYMCLFISFNFSYGLYCAISGVISSFTDPYGY